MEMKVFIPRVNTKYGRRKITSNVINSTHYFTLNKWIKLLHNEIAYQVRAQFIKPINEKDYPLVAQYDFYYTDRLPDYDNTEGVVKRLQDGLINAGILKDDSNKYVVGGSTFVFKTSEAEDFCIIKYKKYEM